MKGGRKRNSNSELPELQSIATPPCGQTAAVDGGGESAVEECRENRDERERPVSAEEAFEDEEGEFGDSEAEKEYEQIEETAEEGGAEGASTKLADGYYEIEAVRRKRVRKGQAQYLIKWRGWPETANTWEPFKNLVQCADVIDTFEESLKAGKSRLTRKKKRKYSITHILPQKKQRQRSPAPATYSVDPHVLRIADDPTPFSTLNNLAVRNENSEVNANGVNHDEIPKQINENGVSIISSTRGEENELNELDLKLCELKGETEISMESTDRVSVPSGEGRSIGVGTSTNELRKIDQVAPVQPGRCTGAKKRKAGSVKRFKKDPASCSMEDAQISEDPRVQYPDLAVNNINCKNKYEDSYSSCNITQIVKPISYRASILNNVQDVLVAFEALRSDGTKVTVDNKFLKANNPLLLIDYYERNLRYNPT